MMSAQDVGFLSSSYTFWNHLNEHQKELVLNNISLLEYQQGDSIHSGDHDCAGLLLVKSGTLRIYILSEEGREITLYRIYEGDVCILSASCLLGNITFDVHIDAESHCQILLLNSSTFDKLSRQNIYVENFSYKIAADRFSDVMWAMQQILFISFDKRLAAFLLEESEKNKSNRINMTHEQIAKYLGSAREVVSRMLKYFKKEGYVALSRGDITIIDKKKLHSIS